MKWPSLFGCYGKLSICSLLKGFCIQLYWNNVDEFKADLAAFSGYQAAALRSAISRPLRRLPAQRLRALSILYCSDSPSSLATLPAVWDTAISRREM